MRNLKSKNIPSGTAIWNLCKKSLNLIQQHLYRILGNGKKKLWEDRILGIPPLSSINSISEIKLWLSNKGLLRLADICLWDEAGNWIGWNFPEIRDRLISEQETLIESLSGLAPSHRSLKDKWGWGSTGVYFMGHGFAEIQYSHVSLLKLTMWNSNWSIYGLPKVKKIHGSSCIKRY